MIAYPVSAALSESPNFIPFHFLILSSHFFFCLLLLVFFTVLCRIAFAMPEDLVMWLYNLSFRFFFKCSSCILDSVANLLVRYMVSVENVQKSPKASNLKDLHPSVEFYCHGLDLTGIQ